MTYDHWKTRDDNEPNTQMVKCPDCDGEGYFIDQFDEDNCEVMCDRCLGTGEIEEDSQ